MRSNVSGFKSENGLRRSIGNHRLPDSRSETGFRLLPIERALTVDVISNRRDVYTRAASEFEVDGRQQT